MRPRFILSLLALVTRPAISDVAFIYPPAFVETTDFSSNIVMVEGEFKVIQWTDVSNPNNARISVTMFQLNGTQFIGDSEYITQNALPDTLSSPWTVNTSKNLTVSPMFYMNLFLEGETSSLTNSQYFNITAKSTTTTTSSTASSATSSATSSAISSATESTIAMTSAGLSTGAKAGIAIGIIGATLLGVVVGWIVVGRRRKVNDTESQASVHLPLQTGYYEPGKVEQPPQYRHEVSGQPAAPVLYEL